MSKLKKLNSAKEILVTILSAILLNGFTSCDTYLERFPETDITEKDFFKSVKDLELYTNTFYDGLGWSQWDIVSDNSLTTNNHWVYTMMRNETTPANAEQWSRYWTSIRSINYMLNRVDQVSGDEKDINHYIGIAKLFRALKYYNLVQTYSDIPWYEKDLQTTDTELLYKPQDSREFVVDKIMEDLDFAVENIKVGSSKTAITKQAALAFKARISLYEGTFRKYHSELELNDGDKFITKAAETAKKLMDMGDNTLSTVQQGDLGAYQSLFCSLDLTRNTEMILMKDYSKELGLIHSVFTSFDWSTSLSRDLMEDYLIIEDGETKSFYDTPNYEKSTFVETFKNRDPRFAQTFMSPGTHSFKQEGAHVPNLLLGGYPQIKYYPTTRDQADWSSGYTDQAIFRYAEVLLIYAEAKAELGKLTQADLNITINLIRERVNMPGVQLQDWFGTDLFQEKKYPNVKSSQKAAVLQIRRERRVELACEGHRYGDLMRWACGSLLNKTPQASYIDKLGYHDLTGDKQPDIAIVKTAEDASTIPAEDIAKYNLKVYILKDNSFALSEGDKGYIYIVAQKDKFTFIEPKYYYYPMAVQDIVINPNLYQNKFWK